MPTSAELERAEALIRTIPDYPEPGVLFRDITPLLVDAAALRTCIDALIEPYQRTQRSDPPEASRPFAIQLRVIPID